MMGGKASKMKKAPKKKCLFLFPFSGFKELESVPSDDVTGRVKAVLRLTPKETYEGAEAGN